MVNLILFVCSIIFFISGNIVLSWNYYKVNQEKYNYFNHFPFELILTRKLNFYFLGLIFYILSYFANIAIIFTMIVSGLDLNQQSFFVCYIVVVVLQVLIIFPFLLILLFNMKNYRLHLFGDIIFFLINTLVSMSLFLMSIFDLFYIFNIKSLIVCIFSSLLSILNFGIILNPKLLNWSKLKEETQEDGTKIYVRPKYFTLCYSEWLSFIIYFLNNLFFIILFL